MKKKSIAAAISAIVLMMSMGAIGAHAATEADSYSRFTYTKSGSYGYAKIENLTSITRWGSVSMMAYDAYGNVVGSAGADNSLSASGGYVDKGETFSGTTASIAYSGVLYYSNNPHGTPFSYWLRSIG